MFFGGTSLPHIMKGNMRVKASVEPVQDHDKADTSGRATFHIGVNDEITRGKPSGYAGFVEAPLCHIYERKRARQGRGQTRSR